MAENIFLFVPNLIGYARVIFALIAFYLMPTDPTPAIFCYLLSGLLDAFDGHAARALNQSTKFGAVLDMVTDRCATAMLCVTLAVLYPAYAFFFQFMIGLDIGSHWIHMYSSLTNNKSHKVIDPKKNWFLRLYYTSRTVLFLMCAGNELFFGSLYILYFFEGPIVPGVAIGVWRLILYICAPVSFVKNVISIIQMLEACHDLAEIDVKARQDARKAK
ncbi:phosphatidylinositol synthase [Capsaspora owczarzaki ATCC 30864]|uniref:CDP-diacylglycerol--inositol 3-phosphatidyltransferase n=1 Tax=Capsaspora owczarzaki (strain ATCC 30864) TaxID=595528 RepID=A0A0D2WVL4_CAPO3|nr:phosphatidylinositol synthase [Capsaspora owczarzaki ATCC 30864]KJE96278.1 phosphatidylinositol synthase [Capsaspora owczarzaki ATCC 30864]|eukprot:XP_004344242.1 phosphatidylinositol synthase [Capsaspora owczarzaki ATCC 30864]